MKIVIFDILYHILIIFIAAGKDSYFDNEIQSVITEAGIIVRTEKFEEVTDFHAVQNTEGRISLLFLRRLLICCSRGRGWAG